MEIKPNTYYWAGMEEQQEVISKILDVLVLGKRSVRFGSPVFISDNKLQKRVVFEYANEAVMNMRFEEKYGRIVMDHLSPEAPALEGIYSYYVPDLSYDSYSYNGAYWVLKEDVIAVNDPEFDPKSFIQINPRTGKLERKKLKKIGSTQLILNKITEILIMWQELLSLNQSLPIIHWNTTKKRNEN